MEMVRVQVEYEHEKTNVETGSVELVIVSTINRLSSHQFPYNCNVKITLQITLSY